LKKAVDAEHYRVREAQERVNAERAANPAVKDLHRQFAERYATMAAAMDSTRLLH